MPRYSRFKYSQGYYGATPSRLGYSVEPFNAFVYDYSREAGRIEISWTPASGEHTQMRIVRNQDAFPETAEDGVIVYDAFAPIEDMFVEDRTDQNYAPFATGRYAYYRAWLLKSDHTWVPAGDTYVLVPSPHPAKTSSTTIRTGVENHSEIGEGPMSERQEYSNLELLSTHDKLMDILPRVYTSVGQNPLDEVDTNSDLYRFLGAFAATLDESLTYTDLLKPQMNQRSANPSTLALAAAQYGLTPEPTLATKSQKRMIREARYMYSRKGTSLATNTMVESLTGFATEVNVSQNLMLTVQDSSFYKGTGYWTPSGSSSISILNDITAPSTEPKAVDLYYYAEVTIDANDDYISNGETSIFTRGIPVFGDLEMTFSYYVRGDSGNVIPSITWYDQLGAVISIDTGAGIAVTADWAKDTSATFTSPTDAAFASIRITFDTAGTYNVDMVQLANSAFTEYTDARTTLIKIYPNKYNFINNPSFENWTGATLNLWDTDGTVTQVPTDLLTSYGETSMAALATNVGSTFISTDITANSLLSNSLYTFSIYAKTDADTETVQLTINADDGENPAIFHTSAEFEITTEWQRIYVSKYFSADAINLNSAAITLSLEGTTTGNTIYLDNSQFEISYAPSDYLDGSAGALEGASWDGVAHASPSYLYPYKVTKMSRLISELQNYLPINTPYEISSITGVDYKTITY